MTASRNSFSDSSDIISNMLQNYFRIINKDIPVKKKMIRAYAFKECEMSRAELLRKKKFVRAVKFWTLSSTSLNGTITVLSSHFGRIS